MEELSQLGVNSHRVSSSSSSSTAAAAAAFNQTSASSPAASVAVAVAPPPLLGKGFFGWPISPLPLISSHHHHHHPFPLHLDAAAASSSCSSQRRSAAGDAATSSSDVEDIKAKIIAHPRYSALLSAYVNCQKVGAPPAVRERLSATAPEFAARQRAALGCSGLPTTPTDPDLDRFMEAYCQMLAKHEEELARPLQEAKEFLRNAEAELNSITHGSFHVLSSDENDSGACSSEEEQELENGTIRDASGQLLPPAAAADMKEPDLELKKYLLKRYSGHLTGLRQELRKKKKKKGKLPKEAIQKLLNWWEMHYKWPYPSEMEKIALAESTGLDQRQINNWFINQRKRHWRPTEEKQFVLMDGAGGFNVAPSAHAAALYMADGLYHLNAP